MLHVVGFLAAGGILPPLIVLTALSAALAWWMRRRSLSRSSWLVLTSAFASIALILTATLLREAGDLLGEIASNGPVAPGLAGLLDWSDDGWKRVSYNPLAHSEFNLNVLLFIPAGFVWTLVTQRPTATAAGLAGLSLLIECIQGVTGLGAPDVSDLVANSTGAAVGALAGGLIRWYRPEHRPTPRGMLNRLVTSCALLTLLVTAVHIGAHHRQESLAAELAQEFAGSSLEEYHAWEGSDELSERVFFRTDATPTDGMEFLNAGHRLRYPASFFGLRRCVFVEWTEEGVEILPVRGGRCTDFLG